MPTCDQNKPWSGCCTAARSWNLVLMRFINQLQILKRSEGTTPVSRQHHVSLTYSRSPRQISSYGATNIFLRCYWTDPTCLWKGRNLRRDPASGDGVPRGCVHQAAQRLHLCCSLNRPSSALAFCCGCRTCTAAAKPERTWQEPPAKQTLMTLTTRGLWYVTMLRIRLKSIWERDERGDRVFFCKLLKPLEKCARVISGSAPVSWQLIAYQSCRLYWLLLKCVFLSLSHWGSDLLRRACEWRQSAVWRL